MLEDTEAAARSREEPSNGDTVMMTAPDSVPQVPSNNLGSDDNADSRLGGKGCGAAVEGVAVLAITNHAQQTSESTAASPPAVVSDKAEEPASATDPKAAGKPDTKSPTAHLDLELKIDRICLTGLHEQGWADCIQPRLYEFCRAVYDVRASDELRYKFLLSSSTEQIEMIKQMCSYV